MERKCQYIIDNISKIPVTNFAPVVAKIALGRLDLKSFKDLPKEIYQEFHIIDPPRNLDEREMIIYWHNFIMSIYSTCEKRYKELESYNFYLFLGTKWDDIMRMKNALFDSSNTILDKFNNQMQYVKKIEISSSKMSTGAEISSKSWIVRQNAEPEPNPSYDLENDIKIFKHHSNAISNESVNLLNDVSHSLDIPDLPSAKSMEQMINAYMKLTNLSQSLPFFIYVLKQKRGNLTKINECFNFLAQAYFQCTSHRSSFLKHHIKSFANSFEHLCARLAQSGVKFNGSKRDFFNSNQFKQNIQDYIEIPDPIPPPPSINYWNENKYKPKPHNYGELTNQLFQSLKLA